MDWMSSSKEAPPQAGIKPCGYLRCLTFRSKRGRKSVGMWYFASTSSARGSRNFSTPSMPDTLNQKRHQRPAVDESRSRYLKEAAFGCFMSPSGSLPGCRFSSGIEQKYQRSRLSSCFFFECQVAASSTHRRTCGRCSVSERRLSAFHSWPSITEAQHARQLAAARGPLIGWRHRSPANAWCLQDTGTA